VVRREHTGVGFYTSLRVAPGIPRITSDHLVIHDVIGTVDGVQHGVGFNLFVTNELVDLLEGFTYDEAWPREVRELSLGYQSSLQTARSPRPRSR
jgi:hypothetical protein